MSLDEHNFRKWMVVIALLTLIVTILKLSIDLA